MPATHLYEELTWSEVNEAVAAGRIPLLPVGTTEQHGPHLPLKIDRWSSTSICNEAARRAPRRLLVMPPISYGYTSHVMDFPGTITIHHETFIRYVVDVLKSLAYHGFKKIIMINGHGSNRQPLELAGRRAMLETDAWVAMASWWDLTRTDPEFMDTWRESFFPGGCSHAGEAETSLALHLDPAVVRMDQAVDVVTDTARAGIQVSLGRSVRRRAGQDGRLDQHLHRRRHAGRPHRGHGRQGPGAVRGGRGQSGGVRGGVRRASVQSARGPPRDGAHDSPAGIAGGGGTVSDGAFEMTLRRFRRLREPHG